MASLENKTIYFLGIGGIGMSALAELSHSRRAKVCGSDVSVNENITRLRSRGIEVKLEQNGEDLPTVDVCVVSSAISDENPDLVAFKKANVEIMHRSAFLQTFLEQAFVIAVTGTHGKTTTASIIAHMLTEMGLDPTVIVGGLMKANGSNLRIGRDDFYVIEADESDRSFLNYRPNIAIINNIGADHLEVHGDLRGAQEAFIQFTKRLREEGTIILGWDDNLVRSIAQEISAETLSFGQKLGSEVRLLSRRMEQEKERWGAVVEYTQVSIAWNLFGRHNCINGLAALATAKALGLDIIKAAAALASFSGVARRLDIVFSSDTTIAIDDYAHNPDKISAVLTMVKERWPENKLCAIFQPHRYSRLRHMEEAFIESLANCDELLLLPTYSAGEADDENYKLERLHSRFSSKLSMPIHKCTSLDSAVILCQRISQSSDPCVIMSLGAGDVYKVTHGLYEKKKEFLDKSKEESARPESKEIR